MEAAGSQRELYWEEHLWVNWDVRLAVTAWAAVSSLLANSQSSKGSIELLSHILHVSTIYKNSFQHRTAKLKPLVQNQSHRSYKVSQEMKQKRIRTLNALYPWSSRKGGSQQMTLEDILHRKGRQNNCNRPASMNLGIFFLRNIFFKICMHFPRWEPWSWATFKFGSSLPHSAQVQQIFCEWVKFALN